jgi:hypothetical protein
LLKYAQGSISGVSDYPQDGKIMASVKYLGNIGLKTLEGSPNGRKWGSSQEYRDNGVFLPDMVLRSNRNHHGQSRPSGDDETALLQGD